MSLPLVCRTVKGQCPASNLVSASHAGNAPSVADPGWRTPLGVLLLDRHFAMSAEVHLMAVQRDWHRNGVGRALVSAAEAAAAADGVRVLSVKTLGPSDPDSGYASTRRFYAAVGFLPLEEIPDLWPGNPCLVMVKFLSA